VTRRYTIGVNKPNNRGVPVPGGGKQTEVWSPEAKSAAVVEIAAMTELELSEYCRRQGLYPEQIRRWKDACIQGAQRAGVQQQRLEAKQDKQRIKALEKELKRKEKALAEAAALLVLRKKLTALWEENEAD
jgi:transposase